VSLTPARRALLVNLRKRAGMSGDDVARATGHTQSWIAHIELGNVETIDEDEFDRLLMLYNTEIQG
jgi:predicted transcriptional regulator